MDNEEKRGYAPEEQAEKIAFGEDAASEEAAEPAESMVSEETAEAEQDAPAEKSVRGKKKQKKSVGREILEWIVSLAVALLVVFVVRSFFVTLIKVDGDSMKPTLLNGERLFVTVLDVKLTGADRGDIVICNYPGRYHKWPLGIETKEYFVKRVVAVEGDTVYRKDNATYVICGDTGETVALDEEFAARAYYAGDDYEYVLQKGEYFVVGDNRGNSHDSRNWNDSRKDDDVGPITKNMLVGKVRCILWPLSEIGGVE